MWAATLYSKSEEDVDERAASSYSPLLSLESHSIGKNLSALEPDALLEPSSDMSRFKLFVAYSSMVANYFDDPCELLSILEDLFLPRAENYLLYSIGFFI